MAQEQHQDQVDFKDQVQWIQNKEKLYQLAQKEYQSRNFETALHLLKLYVQNPQNYSHQRDILLKVIDQIGSIYLFKLNKKEGLSHSQEALDYFSILKNEKQLSEAEEDNLNELMAVFREWQNNLHPPRGLNHPDQLFALGKKSYLRGLEIHELFAKSLAGSNEELVQAHWDEATKYLLPFILSFENDQRLGEALFMMGNLRFLSWSEKTYESENFYFKEVIRRFPHSALAAKAYVKLKEAIQLNYMGSSGDNTPPSLYTMLEAYKKMIRPLEATVASSKNKKREVLKNLGSNQKKTLVGRRME